MRSKRVKEFSESARVLLGCRRARDDLHVINKSSDDCVALVFVSEGTQEECKRESKEENADGVPLQNSCHQFAKQGASRESVLENDRRVASKKKVNERRKKRVVEVGDCCLNVSAPQIVKRLIHIHDRDDAAFGRAHFGNFGKDFGPRFSTRSKIKGGEESSIKCVLENVFENE